MFSLLMPMKFLIASPWENKDAVRSLESALTLRGHVAWSFPDDGANLATGKSVMEEFKQFGHSMVEWENDPLIERIFAFEMQALRDSDAVILLEPAGALLPRRGGHRVRRGQEGRAGRLGRAPGGRLPHLRKPLPERRSILGRF